MFLWNHYSSIFHKWIHLVDCFLPIRFTPLWQVIRYSCLCSTWFPFKSVLWLAQKKIYTTASTKSFFNKSLVVICFLSDCVQIILMSVYYQIGMSQSRKSCSFYCFKEKLHHHFQNCEEKIMNKYCADFLFKYRYLLIF